MRDKMKSFLKKHGLILGIAIIVPGGEIFLLFRYGYSLFKKRQKPLPKVQEEVYFDKVA